MSLVLVYHLWPHGLSGGFIGVDAFFVISGYLITQHLLRHPPRSLGDVATFWGRRARRLLPAALLVLVTTLVATRVVAPETQWERTAQHSRGAALYVLNWMLAGDSVDYLSATDTPTPVQHFWSLSVEEQFYLAWPILLGLLLGLAAWTRVPRGLVPAGLGAVVAMSFGYSVIATADSPAHAYFVTSTRIWELGVGGLLAAMPATRWPARARESAAAVGLGLVVLTAVIYDAGTAFPGWRAALPVAATALVIAAAPRAGDGPVGRALARRPVQSVGDLSYSIYLWHWPLIVLVAYRTGGLGVLDDLAVIVASVFLAALTKRFVEDPFRRPRRTHPTARALLLGAGGMAVVVGLAGAQLVEVHHRDDRAEARVLSAVANAGPCFGAAALSHAGCPLTLRAPVVPGPAAAARDWSDAWAEPKQAGVNCFAYPQLYASRGCTFGDPRGHISVALAGNSHAAHLLPALEVLAKVEHWRITTFLAGGCALSDTAQVMGNTEANASCADWVHRTVGQISAGHFDLVVMANRMYPVHPGTEQVGAYREGYRRVLGEFSRAHLRVLALHDTPAPIDGGLLSVPDCLASHPTDYRPCTGNRGWIPPDPVGEAVLAVHDRRISMLDLNDHICGRRECAGAVGGVVVYFDGLHLTATFARTLAPYLNLPIRRALHTP